MVSLQDKANAYSRSLSGGMKRRLLIAKAMVHQPPILILDEPTAGVDVELRNNLWENVIINKGNLVALDTTEKLLERIKTKKINFKVKNIELNKNLMMKDINFKINSENSILVTYEKNSLDFGEIINYLNENNIKIEDISTEDGDLEDVFVQLTKH